MIEQYGGGGLNKYFITGFVCSLTTFITTIILANVMQITELNPIMNMFLDNTYYAIMFYSLVWSLLFTIYRYFEETNQKIYVNYLSYLVFFVFGFDLMHDLISIGGYLL